MKVYLVLLLIGLVFISGCVDDSGASGNCPTCPSAGSWSDCEDGVKTRENYQCNPNTNYTCESYVEEKSCKNEIILKGSSLEGVVSPTSDEVVNGIIKTEVTKVPADTTGVVFVLAPQGTIRPGMEEENAIIIIDAQEEDGWKALMDTTKVDNGLYDIFIAAMYEDAPEDNPWRSYAFAQVIVEN